MFYISTVGSTGSIWLTRALNMHPEINCFHGVRSLFPKNADGAAEQSPGQFVKSLNQLYSLSEGYKAFGAVHGFLGREVKPEIDAFKGAFAAMSRHPIARVNSIFHREIHSTGRDQGSGGIFRIDPASYGDVFRFFREDRTATELEPYARLAYIACGGTVREDMWLFDNLDEPQIFRYERLFTEPQYFRSCFEYIAAGCRNAMRHIEWPLMMRNVDWSPGAPRLDCSDDYLAAVFGMGRVNEKTVGPRTVEEIFANWPDQFRLIFAAALKNSGGSSALERYAAFGYPLPKFFETIFQNGSGGFRAPFEEVFEDMSRLPDNAGPANVLNSRIMELEREIESIRSSTSWRLTAPMRALRNLLSHRPTR